MVLLLLKSINKIGWKRVGAIGAAGVFVLLIIYCYLQHVALKQNQLIYQNPAVVERVKTVRVEGPVRIVTRTIETPGRVERVVTEERGPVSVVKESLRAETPVFPPVPRSDRWIAGIAGNPFSYRDSRYWAVYAGYSFRNRFDLMGGVNSGRPSVLFVVRF
jgi:hypothetical protein